MKEKIKSFRKIYTLKLSIMIMFLKISLKDKSFPLNNNINIAVLIARIMIIANRIELPFNIIKMINKVFLKFIDTLNNINTITIKTAILK